MQGSILKTDLNSIMILLIPIEGNTSLDSNDKFKFHYDSINSSEQAEANQMFMEFKFHYDSINSLAAEKRTVYSYNLNSIMILLIPRPKIIPLFKPKNVSILSTSSKFNISFLSLIIYFCNTSYFRRFRLLSIPYIFCTIMGRQKPLIFQVDFVRHILL